MEISKIVKEFSKEIMDIVKAVIESNILDNHNIGSDIYKNLKVIAKNDGDLVFDILLNDYLTYIESGRRKGAKMPPVEPIVRWARSRGIPTDNSTIYLSRRAISRDGIAPRPFMATVMEQIDLNMENLYDKIFDEITKLINDFFNK